MTAAPVVWLEVFESFGLGALHLDSESKILAANPSMERWLQRGPLVGQSLQHLLAPGSVLYWDTAVVQSIIANGGAQDVVLGFNAGPRMASFLLFATKSSGGFHCAFVPYSLRTKYEADQRALALRLAKNQSDLEQLRQINVFRSDFVNLVSHELATPITPLRLDVFRLAKLLGDSEERPTEEVLARIQRNLDILQRLATNVTQAARLQAGSIGLAIAPHRLDHLVRDTVSELRANPRFKDIHLGVESVDCNLDPKATRTCLDQLLDNALKFSRPGSPIRVIVTSKPYPRVVVQDEGRGIDPERLKSLAGPFMRLHTDTEFSGLGAGIGLFIVHELMVAQKGGFVLESPGLGQGTVARMEFAGAAIPTT